MNTPRYREEVTKILASMDAENNQEQKTPTETPQPASGEQEGKTPHGTAIQDIYVYIVREREEEQEEPPETNVVETTLVKPKKPPVYIAYAICLFYLFLILSTLAFQAYEILNPPIATVTIIPKSQPVALNGTLQLGRILSPLTLSQSQTVPTTGRGRQDARQATGFITLYNGQLQSVTVSAGTILTGSNGVQIAIDQDAVIPAESQTIPPTLGQITVSAHAVVSGTRGNISTGNINQGCCAASVLAQNTSPFHGGQDERNYQTVAKSDINYAATPLITALIRSVSSALHGQVTNSEALQALPCTPTVRSDRQAGQEATTVQVTVSETCGAVAYSKDALRAQATTLLTIQATQRLGIGYTLVGEIHLTIRQATVTHITPTLVFSCQGEWVYGVTNAQQRLMKSLIAGKTKQQALDVLAHLPGIVQATIGDVDGNAKLPRNPALIHLVILEQLG